MERFFGQTSFVLLKNAIASIIKYFMARCFPSICLAMVVGALTGSADARGRPP
jgi:hypothetical protein